MAASPEQKIRTDLKQTSIISILDLHYFLSPADVLKFSTILHSKWPKLVLAILSAIWFVKAAVMYFLITYDLYLYICSFFYIYTSFCIQDCIVFFIYFCIVFHSMTWIFKASTKYISNLLKANFWLYY